MKFKFNNLKDLNKDKRIKNKNINIRTIKGITLIALVITIIVLLILAGVSIAMLTGQNGILNQANKAKVETEKSTIEEQKKLAQIEASMNLENKKYTDKNGNIAIIPEGFAVSNIEDEREIDKGLVIIDKDGNEFVWIPVGTINKGDGTTAEITLNRYIFEADGKPIPNEENAINSYSQELATSSYGNIVAKNIDEFRTSVNNNHGYYIARYEASKNTITGKVESKTATVWNNIAQPQAATACREMYASNSYISDLINSYAWDTAIVFIQEFSDNKNYSNQTSLNTKIENTGSSGDEKCHIQDMASNVYEWTTETYSDSNTPCTLRGGGIYPTDKSTGRYYRDIAYKNQNTCFRPIIYIK